MNKKRREKISNAIWSLNIAKDILGEVLPEETEAFENTPENLQESERYYSMEETIDTLDSAIDGLDEVISSLEECIEK